jgi:flavin-dependent thymidylate synthase
MKVVLAGYNVDTRVLKKAEEAGVAGESLTPEVLAAAYARISRDPSDVGELRRAALEEVEKARSSNRKIIFEMGHHSVAEHAVFNFDIVGISRLAVEWLERFRLCSFTEKSQRYITLDHDFVLPNEVANTPLESELISLVKEQSVVYDRLYSGLRDRLTKSHPDMEDKKKGRTLLDGRAKEDARYVTLLATTGQLGLTVNARNLELMVRRFAVSPLEEVRELGRSLFQTAVGAAPSLLLFTEPSAYDSETGKDLSSLAASLMKDPPFQDAVEEVRLVGYTKDPDRLVAAALLHTFSQRSFEQCRITAESLSVDDLLVIFETALKRMEFFDSTPREFEHVVLNFELVLSAAAYGQLKRHRMSTQSMQAYDPSLGLTVPPAVEQAGMTGELASFAEKAERLFKKMGGVQSPSAAYALTNAHRRRVFISTNLRELYHIVRLREDGHAQWDIRNIAFQMRRTAEKAMPLGTILLCGKDGYPDRYAEIFGRMPSIIPPA